MTLETPRGYGIHLAQFYHFRAVSMLAGCDRDCGLVKTPASSFALTVIGIHPRVIIFTVTLIGLQANPNRALSSIRQDCISHK